MSGPVIEGPRRRRLRTALWPPNHGSPRALEKTGGRRCGLTRRHLFVDGRRLDVWPAEIHRAESERARASACTAR